METTIAGTFKLNNAIYLENWVNARHKILGVTLAPLCLLHLQWLEQIGSPLFYTSKAVTLPDLEVAVLICSSRSSDEILQKLNRRGILRKLWLFKNKSKDLTAEVKRFLDYQDDFCSLPEFASKDGNETDAKLPWLLIQLATLAKATGWQQEYIQTLPVGQVVWLNCAFAYLNTGETSIISDKEKAAMAALDAYEKLTGGG